MGGPVVITCRIVAKRRALTAGHIGGELVTTDPVPPSHDRSEQGSNAASQCHGECAPKRDAYSVSRVPVELLLGPQLDAPPILKVQPAPAAAPVVQLDGNHQQAVAVDTRRCEPGSRWTT